MIIHIVVRQAVKPYATAFSDKDKAQFVMNQLIDYDYSREFGQTSLFEQDQDSKRSALAEVGIKYAIQSVILDQMNLQQEDPQTEG